MSNPGYTSKIFNLLALSAKTEKMIDFESALEYPLCSIPLSIANVDGKQPKVN